MKPKTAGRIFVLCVLALLASGQVSAQRRDRTIFQFQHTTWTAKDGAPSPIFDLAQTLDGYLWIATPAGLYRFDGLRFERFRPPLGQTFQSDNISCLMATPDGGVWIGLSFGGADFLKDGHVTHYVQPDGVPGGTIWGFAMDHDGIVWAAINGGLARFDGSRWHRIGADWGFSGQTGTALFVDHAGTLWAASENALFFLTRGEKHFLKVADLRGKTSSITETSDGTLWVSVCCGGDPIQDLTARAAPIEVPQTLDRAKLPRKMVKLQAVVTGRIDHAGSLWLTTDSGVFLRRWRLAALAK
jgi:ligand-binding sensor domain-containing protein